MSNVQDSFAGNPNLYGASFAPDEKESYQPLPLPDVEKTDCETQTCDIHHYEHFSSEVILNQKQHEMVALIIVKMS